MTSKNASRVRIGLLGGTGRMGTRIRQLIKEEYSSRAELAVAAGEGDSLEPLFESDVIIDFSLPRAFGQFVSESAGRAKLPAIVSGTTGWTDVEWAGVQVLAQKTHLLWSSNFSIGVSFLKEILRQAAPGLLKAGYVPSISETHHVHKVDAPSGTAKTLREIISPQKPNSIDIRSIREGEVVGDHEISFVGTGDRIVLGHFAQDRSIFARGAIEAALWLKEFAAQNKNSGKVLDMGTFFKARYGHHE